MSNDGYTVVRCANWLIGKRRGNIDRLLENITFGMSSSWAALREGRPDLVIIETWALFAVTFSALLARFWCVPYLYYVQDAFPEAAEQAGMLKASGKLSQALRSWDRRLCMYSASTITVSEAMKTLLATNRELPDNNFTVIPNWIDESAFPVWKGDYSWRRSLGIPDSTFIAMFAGTLGHVSGAEVLVEVARILRPHGNILLLCIGEGILKEPMAAEASRLHLDNLLLIPFQPFDRVPEVQASCQVTLLTMHPNHSDASVPSKLISYLAASRPIICAADPQSTVSRIVSEAAAGLVVCPGDAQAIADAIIRLMREPEIRNNMGMDGRRYFEKHFTLEHAHQRFRSLINSVRSSKEPNVAVDHG